MQPTPSIIQRTFDGSKRVLGQEAGTLDNLNVSDSIQPLTGESPSELQKRIRLERQVDAGDFEPVSEENRQEEPDQDHGMCMG